MVDGDIGSVGDSGLGEARVVDGGIGSRDSRVLNWLIGRHGTDFIEGVSIDDCDGRLEVLIHLSRLKRFRHCWKEVQASMDQCELENLLGGVHCEFYGIYDS